MWLLLICVAIVSTWAIVAAVNSAAENIIGELKASRTPHTDSHLEGIRHDLDGIERALKEIKELLSISCPQCGEEPFVSWSTPVAEQRVWLEEHTEEHKSGKLERRALNDIVAERHAAEETKHEEFKASICQFCLTSLATCPIRENETDEPPISSRYCSRGCEVADHEKQGDQS